MAFLVQLIGWLADGSSRPLTDNDGITVTVNPETAGFYDYVDASNGTINDGTGTGRLDFWRGEESVGSSDDFTWGQPSGEIVRVTAVITPDNMHLEKVTAKVSPGGPTTGLRFPNLPANHPRNR